MRAKFHDPTEVREIINQSLSLSISINLYFSSVGYAAGHILLEYFNVQNAMNHVEFVNSLKPSEAYMHR